MRKASLIIGGSSGIGLAIAELLASEGRRLTVIGRNRAKLEVATSSLLAAGAKSVEALSVDLHDEQEVDRLATQVEGSSYHYDQLVNAAGYFFPRPFLEHRKSDYDQYQRLNRAFFFITQSVAKNMIRNGGGAIVNIGSMWAQQAIKATPSSAYSMAKAGIHSLTQHLAMELADHGIRVNAVSPAVVVTPIYGAFIDPAKIEEALTEGFDSFHPIGRVGRPSDVAEHAHLLLSDRARWTTGAIHSVDGGVTAGRN